MVRSEWELNFYHENMIWILHVVWQKHVIGHTTQQKRELVQKKWHFIVIRTSTDLKWQLYLAELLVVAVQEVLQSLVFVAFHRIIVIDLKRLKVYFICGVLPVILNGKNVVGKCFVLGLHIVWPNTDLLRSVMYFMFLQCCTILWKVMFSQKRSSIIICSFHRQI